MRGTPNRLEQVIRPVEPVDVEEHGARGVAVVGHVAAAAGEPPDQEAVDGPGPQASLAQQIVGAGPVREQPLELGGAEVRVEPEPGERRHPGAA